MATAKKVKPKKVKPKKEPKLNIVIEDIVLSLNSETIIAENFVGLLEHLQNAATDFLLKNNSVIDTDELTKIIGETVLSYGLPTNSWWRLKPNLSDFMPDYETKIFIDEDLDLDEKLRNYLSATYKSISVDFLGDYIEIQNL